MGLVDYLNKAPSREKLLRGEIPKWIANNKRGKYIAQVILSCPPWADRAAIRVMRDEARRLTKMTGKQYVMAHRVPLNHPLVCGLTVPWNFEIRPWSVNASEGNGFNLDQLELFDEQRDRSDVRQQDIEACIERSISLERRDTRSALAALRSQEQEMAGTPRRRQHPSDPRVPTSIHLDF